MSSPAPPQGEEDLFVLSTIEWELGVVDRNCRKLLRVMTGIEQAYSGTSNETPEGRAQLKKQLDGLQLEREEYRGKREALLLRISQQPGLQIPFTSLHSLQIHIYPAWRSLRCWRKAAFPLMYIPA